MWKFILTLMTGLIPLFGRAPHQSAPASDQLAAAVLTRSEVWASFQLLPYQLTPVADRSQLRFQISRGGSATTEVVNGFVPRLYIAGPSAQAAFARLGTRPVDRQSYTFYDSVSLVLKSANDNQDSFNELEALADLMVGANEDLIRTPKTLQEPVLVGDASRFYTMETRGDRAFVVMWRHQDVHAMVVLITGKPTYVAWGIPATDVFGDFFGYKQVAIDLAQRQQAKLAVAFPVPAFTPTATPTPLPPSPAATPASGVPDVTPAPSPEATPPAATPVPASPVATPPPSTETIRPDSSSTP